MTAAEPGQATTVKLESTPTRVTRGRKVSYKEFFTSDSEQDQSSSSCSSDSSLEYQSSQPALPEQLSLSTITEQGQFLSTVTEDRPLPCFSESEPDTSPRSLVKALKLTSPVKSTMAEKQSCNLTELLQFMVQRDEEKRQEADRQDKIRKEEAEEREKIRQQEERTRREEAEETETTRSRKGRQEAPDGP